MTNSDRLLRIVEILRQETDEDHPIRTADLIRRLEQDGIPTERKTVYRAMETLTDNGFDIVSTRVPEPGYFLGSRDFEKVEIRLLIDAVSAASFVTQKKTDVLVKKLLQLVSTHQARDIRSRIFIDNRVKSTNEYIYFALDRIGTAIEQNKQISLTYHRGGTSKTHILSPYAMVWNNDKFYLVGNKAEYQNLMHMRLDRISDVEMLNTPSRPFREVSSYQNFFDSADYVSKHIHMFGGDTETVELLCTDKGLELLTDLFEPTTAVKREDGTYVRLQAATGQGMVGFLAQCGKEIRVLSPETLVCQVKERAREILVLYEN